MRVTTFFNRLLGFAGTVVDEVVQTANEILVDVRLRAGLLVCPCGRTSTATYDRSRRSWRHVDFGRFKVIIRAEVRRVDCRGCGQVRTEWMPFARPGSRFTRDFEDMTAWLATKMSKTAITMLLRTTWETVDRIVRSLVGAHLTTDRLDNLYHIGIDEIAYRKGRKFLTVVTDHDTGSVVWLGEGHSSAVLSGFFELLTDGQRQQITAITMDMTKVYNEAIRTHVPHATICYDPFHVIKWAGETVEQMYFATSRDPSLTVEGLPPDQVWRRVRASLRAGAENLDDIGRAIIDQLRRKHPRLHSTWQHKERLRGLYQLTHPDDAPDHLRSWLTSALRSNVRPIAKLARRIRRNYDGIVAAVQLGLSNSLTEGINAGIRLIQRRAHGYANLDNLIEMIYLCHGGIPVRLPGRTAPSDP